MTDGTDPISLYADDSIAMISTAGAYLSALSLAGQPTLFEKTTVAAMDTTKIRGGCHVCLPNFGPGGSSGLPQHGFARESMWTVTDQSDAAISLELYVPDGDYAGMDARLDYRLESTAINMQLTVHNNSDEQMRISPGFHPYFQVQRLWLSANSTEYQKQDIGEPQQFITASPVNVVVDDKTYVMEAQNLPYWLVWSDSLGEYACVEPTTAGFSFARDDPQAGQPVTMEPRQVFTCGLRIQAIV